MMNDIIVGLGKTAVSNLEEYMKALSGFTKGDSTTVKIRRGDNEKVFNIRF
jgi:S1-C subfamily serine protease